MVKALFCILSVFVSTATTIAQNGDIKVFASPDTVLIGNDVTVYFELHNAKGSFIAPDIEGLEVVGGPNYSSSFSMINGETSSISTYSYVLRPRSEGSFFIGPASIEAKDQVYSTDPLEIIVLPNPNGIRQEPQRNYTMPDPWSAPQKVKKKKRKRGIKL